MEQTLSEVSSKYGKPFVSISYANSEIGVIQDIKTIASIVHKYNGLLHVDATQMYPWRSIDVKDLGIDLMSVSGQKMHCVKGIGFLYVRNGIRLRPLIYGSQQDGRRGGTYPTHLIAAFGAALETTRMNDDCVMVWMLRNKLLDRLLQIEGTHLNGPSVTGNRLPNNISLTIDGVSADTLTTLCDMMGVIIAKGSACKSYEPKPSEALLAMGLTEEQALNTIRISLGMMNTIDEIEYAADIITNMIQRIREDE
jgi:cysteine desulfurase